jgi:hypothetical protein
MAEPPRERSAPVRGGAEPQLFSSSALLEDRRHRLLRFRPAQGVHLHLHRDVAANTSINTEWADDISWAPATRALQSWEAYTRVMRRCVVSLQDPKTGSFCNSTCWWPMG